MQDVWPVRPEAAPPAATERPARETWIHAGLDPGLAPCAIPPADAFVRTSVAIPVHDGTRLRADLHVPAGTGPVPAGVEITPYGAQGLARFGRLYAARGYLYLAVDCRGRYRSEGHWDPLTHDRDAGHDVIGWMARHALCNGRVGTRGHSYSGFNQLLAAIDAPAALQAMVVGMAPGDPFVNTPLQGGAYDLNDLFWLLGMSGRVCSEETGRKELVAEALAALPFGEVDLRLGAYRDTFRTWIAHWRLDEFWRERSVGHRLHRTDVPTLHVSGWWDGNGAGAPTCFEGMRRRARTAHGRENQRLLIGPWNHDLAAPDGSDLPADEATAIARGALRDPLNDELAWFDRYLKDLPAGRSCASRVTLFVTGLGRWADLPDWPVPGARETSLWLGEEGGRRMLADAPAAAARPWTYRFDPRDPTPYAPARVDGDRVPFDNAALQAARRDLLLFDGPPLSAPLLALGPVRAELLASASTPDFDLCVALYDVHPDGRSIYLTDGILRARFREGFEDPRRVPPGTPQRYGIDLWHVGHVFRAGHRVRVQVASAAHLKFDVNPCTGGSLTDETERRVADIRIEPGPSRLVLPIAPLSLIEEGDGSP